VVEAVTELLPDDEAVAIDPFAFVPDWTSRVAGLHAGGPPGDENYVFHTLYADYGAGEVTVTVQFTGLSATRGSLVLRVAALSSRPGSAAFHVTHTEVPLRLVQFDGGRAQVSFTPAPETRYAVLGHIYDETDAAAEKLSVTVQRSAAIEARLAEEANIRRTAFGTPTIRPSSRLTASEPPRLADPVSQLGTAAQYDEPVYAEWAARLKEPVRRHPAQWQSIYILQALRRYGMLEPGAHGLGFGRDTGALPAIMAATRCRVTMTDPAAGGATHWRRPDIVDDTVFDGHVAFRPVERAAPLPENLAGFDFLWAGADNRDLGTVAAVTDFILRSLDCLKPGGLAVHVAATDPQPDAETDPAGDNPVLPRVAFDRLALALIGHGHEVAQLNYLGELESGPTYFGLTVRRSLRG
jgi:hypothetical protein